MLINKLLDVLESGILYVLNYFLFIRIEDLIERYHSVSLNIQLKWYEVMLFVKIIPSDGLAESTFHRDYLVDSNIRLVHSYLVTPKKHLDSTAMRIVHEKLHETKSSVSNKLCPHNFVDVSCYLPVKIWRKFFQISFFFLLKSKKKSTKKCPLKILFLRLGKNSKKTPKIVFCQIKMKKFSWIFFLSLQKRWFEEKMFFWLKKIFRKKN